MIYPFTCTCSPMNQTSALLKVFKSSGLRRSLSNTSQYRIFAELLGLYGSFDLPFIVYNINDHGIVILRVNGSWIFLREGNYGLWCLRLTFAFNIMEVFYILDLESVPSTDRVSFPAFGESSCNIIEHVSHNFSSLALGCLFLPCWAQGSLKSK